MFSKLTRQEEKILALLAKGFKYRTIATHLQLALNLVHFYAYRIRKKTGIKDTKSAAQCKAFTLLRKPHLAIVTEAQKKVLALYAMGKTHREIADILKIKKSTGMDHVSDGCKRLNITVQGFPRRQQIAFLLGMLLDPMLDPVFN